jgi:arylamine N-acetyltransferase
LAVGGAGIATNTTTLFASVLREIGISVTPLAARVRCRQNRGLACTHTCLCARVGDTGWIVDTEASIETDVTNSEQALLEVLRENFGLQFAAATRSNECLRRKMSVCERRATTTEVNRRLQYG